MSNIEEHRAVIGLFYSKTHPYKLKTTYYYTLYTLLLYILVYLLDILSQSFNNALSLFHKSKFSIFSYLLNFCLCFTYHILWLHMLLILAGDVEVNPGPPTPDEHTSKNLSVCHLNIRSISAPGRLEELSDFITCEWSFDMVALSENI